MLPWWGWVLLWVVLLVGGAALVGWRAWRVWGKVTALGAEVADAERTAAALRSQVARVAVASAAVEEELAVFRDPDTVRRERLAVRETLREQRRTAARERRPGWARSVD